MALFLETLYNGRMEAEKLIKISVRNLVEFILREGDIDNRMAGGMDKDAMLQGSRIHRKIQRRMGSDYRAEVSLQIQIPCEGFALMVEGRADGIVEDADGILIDEIKGVLKELAMIAQPAGVHIAQAKCYAYIYARENGLKKIGVQMTYCQMETEEIKRFTEWFEYAGLERWFLDLIKQYEKWARFTIEWKEERNDSISRTEFPFPYREGQRELVTSVYRTILRKKKLFIQAPTGVGKTMAAIFPAVRAVGEEQGEKVFYLTAKTVTRTVAEQAFYLLKEQGLKWKVITLTAKEKICFCEETQCHPDYCLYAKGHYDRINAAVYDMIMNTSDMSREKLEEQARKFQVCPFEMALDVSLWVDAVICDYNYVFDPNAHLRRFFSEGNKGNYLFLIDEAHNLVERGREMYSAILYKEDIMAVRRQVKHLDYKLTRCLEECNKQLLILKRECENWQLQTNVSHIALKLMHLMAEMERFLEICDDQEKRETVLELYFQVRMFLYVHDILDENYVIYTELEPDGRFKLKLYCVNPSVNLQAYLNQGNSTVFFSATLLPIHYYKQLLSVETDDYAIYAESTFPGENRLLLIGTGVNTRYTMRSPQMYQSIAAYIQAVVAAKKGNYIAFFPSYRFMQDVYDCFMELLSASSANIECLTQSQFMSEEAREIFLETFAEERENSLVGLCVMGGIFSEGIDLTADRLIGAVVVGTGLPQVCNDREILKDFFDKKGMRGFDYAYLYPGMNKVLQSAGRVIRTENDKGVILLLDERFLQRQYLEIFPREWNQYQVCQITNMAEYLETFWQAK